MARTHQITAPFREKGVGNSRPTLHPKNAQGLIDLALMVNMSHPAHVQKAAQYVLALGRYLSSPDYLKVKAKHMERKLRSPSFLMAEAKRLERKQQKLRKLGLLEPKSTKEN